MEPPVFGVVLAAGASSRMGRLKQLLLIDGETFVERAIRTLREAGASRVYVVLGAEADRVRAALPEGTCVVENLAWASGQLSSARAGLSAALDAGAQTVVLSLVDHPALRPETARALLAADADGSVPLVRGRRGHPLCLSLEAGRRVLKVEGAMSLKEALAAANVVISDVPSDDLGALGNINTDADLPP